MLRIVLLSALLLLLQQRCFSQSRLIDSLKTALQTATQDTARLRIYLEILDSCDKKDNLLYSEHALKLVDKILSGNIDKKQRDKIIAQEGNIYNSIAAYYSNDSGIDWNKYIGFAKKRLSQIEETGNKKRIAETLSDFLYIYSATNDTANYIETAQKILALYTSIKDSANIIYRYISLSSYYRSIGNFRKSLESVQEAIIVSKELHYKKGEAIGSTALGDLYRDNGEDEQALENYKSALAVLNEIKDSNLLFNTIAALGGYYYKQNNKDKAFECYSQLLDICAKNKEIDHDSGSVYKWIGIVYRDNNDYSNSLFNLYRSLAIFNSTKNIEESKFVMDEIGTTYSRQGDFKNAIEFHRKGLKTADSLYWDEQKARSRYLIALDYYAQKNYKTANEFIDQVLDLLKQNINIKSVGEAELLASQIDSARNDGAGAYAHYKEYISLRDKLKGEEIRRGAQIEKFKNESDKQKTAQQIKDTDTRRLKNQQYFLIAVLGVIVIAVLAIALLQWRNNKHKQKVNGLLLQQKEKVENALSELKATQAQLIQSEKMASLGQLTAGIAHEIQNPLNFVNNFSEVSNELIDEMKGELTKGNYEDAKEIADDVKQNLEKINHHGKRADAIVKGMLQHSQISSGIKEPTDINALADEYLRISYHGIRGKDKSFNAALQTGFDSNIGKINIIPQDIGRVLLNLYNNAFYAVHEKKKSTASAVADEYEPTVSISTKQIGDKSDTYRVEIKVSDNGNGIPQNIVDKIYQPFFTTKPTGQGTGLGLSLSYDIIKAHGGEIKVETNEGEGATFIILLPLH